MISEELHNLTFIIDIRPEIVRFAISKNLPYCLKLNVSRRIRETRINPTALKEAVAFMRSEMHALLCDHEV